MSNVNHPRHYNRHPSGIECIDVIEHFNCNVANAIKYLWRADYKDATIEDLEKAAWYVKREIRKRKIEKIDKTMNYFLSVSEAKRLEITDMERIRMSFVMEAQYNDEDGWVRP